MESPCWKQGRAVVCPCRGAAGASPKRRSPRGGAVPTRVALLQGGRTNSRRVGTWSRMLPGARETPWLVDHRGRGEGSRAWGPLSRGAGRRSALLPVGRAYPSSTLHSVVSGAQICPLDQTFWRAAPGEAVCAVHPARGRSSCSWKVPESCEQEAGAGKGCVTQRACCRRWCVFYSLQRTPVKHQFS